MSGAAVTTEIACDTTRTVGVEACGEPVGIGSGVRTSVVAVGSTVGAGVRVGVSLARLGAVGEAEPLGAAAGAVHAPEHDQGESDGEVQSHRRDYEGAFLLHVTFGHGPAYFHSVLERDIR